MMTNSVALRNQAMQGGAMYIHVGPLEFAMKEISSMANSECFGERGTMPGKIPSAVQVLRSI